MNSWENSVKALSALLSCMINVPIHELFQCEVRHQLYASRLVHDELSSLDSSINIYSWTYDIHEYESPVMRVVHGQHS